MKARVIGRIPVWVLKKRKNESYTARTYFGSILLAAINNKETDSNGRRSRCNKS